MAGMFGRIVRFYDLLNRVLSLGLDQHWRKVLARNVRLGESGVVLDLAAGTLDVSLAIRRQYPTALVPALDFCPPMLV
ncbi:class I SAM-dependent methyltransferase, partial [Desulfovibrio sp. 1188_IL3213]